MYPTPDTVIKGIMFSGCLSAASVHPERACYHDISRTTNSLSNPDETDREYSQAPTDYLIRLWESKVFKVTALHQGGEDIYVDAWTFKTWFSIVIIVIFTHITTTAVMLVIVRCVISFMASDASRSWLIFRRPQWSRYVRCFLWVFNSHLVKDPLFIRLQQFGTHWKERKGRVFI